MHSKVGRHQCTSESNVSFTSCLLRYRPLIDYWRQHLSFNVFDIPQSCAFHSLIKKLKMASESCVNIRFWPTFSTKKLLLKLLNISLVITKAHSIWLSIIKPLLCSGVCFSCLPWSIFVHNHYLQSNCLIRQWGNKSVA